MMSDYIVLNGVRGMARSQRSLLGCCALAALTGLTAVACDHNNAANGDMQDASTSVGMPSPNGSVDTSVTVGNNTGTSTGGTTSTGGSTGGTTSTGGMTSTGGT